MTNRGKQFEEKFKEDLKTHFLVHRLPDNTAGFAGGRNICDFMAFKTPYLHYLELKSTKEGTLNFNAITENQWLGLLEVDLVPGSTGGYVIWFIGHDETYWVSASYANYLKQNGAKSISLKHLRENNTLSNPECVKNKFFKIQGNKKRVFFSYDMPDFESNLERYINYRKGG